VKKQVGCNSKCSAGSSREAFYHAVLDRPCTQSMQIAEAGREYTPDIDGGVGSVQFIGRGRPQDTYPHLNNTALTWCRHVY